MQFTLSVMLVTAYSNRHTLLHMSTYNNLSYTVLKWKCRNKIRSFFLLLWQNLTPITVKYSSKFQQAPNFWRTIHCVVWSLLLTLCSS